MGEMLKRKGAKPLYKQLIEQIQSQIESGDLEAGEMLLSEREMCRVYEVSQITVRQALARLGQAGWVESVPGKGSFVAERGLAHEAKSTCPIGIMLPESDRLIGKAFMADFMRGASMVACKWGYFLNLYAHDGVQYLQDALHDKLQGLIVTSVPVSQWHVIKQAGIPFVLVGDWTEEGVFTADVDNVNVAFEQTQHLLERGCQRIGLINGGSNNPDFLDDRRHGYREALRAVGIKNNPCWECISDFSYADGYRLAVDLLEQHVDGLVCVDDLVASAAARAVLDAGLIIPDEVAIVGCNNTCIAEGGQPPLSTFDLNPGGIGGLAMEKLIRILRGETPPLRSVTSGRLVVRASSMSK